MVPDINYSYLSKFIDLYTNMGYEYKSLSWICQRESSFVTCEHVDRIYSIPLGDLVGSAEQSFISILDDLETETKYVACTPCFRNETEDDLHQKYFMKVELGYKTQKTPNFDIIIDDVITNLLTYVSQSSIKVETISECQKDIIINGIEFGSYGYRNINGIFWVYGTGVAEPRFSKILKSLNGT